MSDPKAAMRELLAQYDAQPAASQAAWRAVAAIGVDPTSTVGHNMVAVSALNGEMKCSKCGGPVQSMVKCCGQYSTEFSDK